jgi:hypothetical protein
MNDKDQPVTERDGFDEKLSAYDKAIKLWQLGALSEGEVRQLRDDAALKRLAVSQHVSALREEVVFWKDAAIELGNELARPAVSVTPKGVCACEVPAEYVVDPKGACAQFAGGLDDDEEICYCGHSRACHPSPAEGKV